MIRSIFARFFVFSHRKKGKTLLSSADQLRLVDLQELGQRNPVAMLKLAMLGNKPRSLLAGMFATSTAGPTVSLSAAGAGRH